VRADARSKIKFIKFFAWEDRWIDRTMAAREEEMKWMVKSASVNPASASFISD
jgi:hypothetical protein